MDKVELAYTAVFTALVCITTMMLQVYIPETKGYFNIGEVMIYITAILLGPRVGMLAGGIGSALADVLTGYTIFAPATLVIKGCEGFLTGLLSQKLGRRRGFKRPYLTLIAGALIGVLIWVVGANLYAGTAEVTLGYTIYTLRSPSHSWVIAGIAAALLTVSIGLLVGTPIGAYLIATLIGGSIMVSGYFLYESLLMGVPAALAELPFNIGQVIVGISVSIPLSNALLKALRESLRIHAGSESSRSKPV